MASTDWRNRFKTYCIDHKGILHDDASNKAFLSSWSELQKKSLPELVVVFMRKPSSFKDNKDNIFKINNFEIMFLKSVKKQDIDAEEAAYAFCEQLAADFISRMKLERGLPSNTENRILYFNVNECRTDLIALLDKDRRFGVSLYCSPGDNNPVAYDSDRWNS